MNSFNYRDRDVLSGPHLLGVLLILAGLFALLSPVFFSPQIPIRTSTIIGAVTVLIGSLIVSTGSGTLISFTEGRVKEYVSIGRYRVGRWSPLPVITAVQVVSGRYNSTNTPNGISPTFSGKVTKFDVRLFSGKSAPVLSFSYSNEEQAVEDAKRLATSLNVPLVVRIAE